MSPEEIQLLAEEALVLTPGKAARVSLVLEEKPGQWVVLVVEGGEELAIRVDEYAHESRQALRRALISEIRSLF